MSLSFPYTETQIYEESNRINDIYNIANNSLRDLMKETIKTNNIIKNKSMKTTTDPNIKEYLRDVRNKSIDIDILQDTLNSEPSINELENSKIGAIKKVTNKTKKLEDEIDEVKNNIDNIQKNISEEKKNIDSSLKVKLDNLNNEITVTKNKKQNILDDEFYKDYIHQKKLLRQKDINRMDLNNNKTYDTIIYNMKEDDKKKDLSNNKKRLQIRTDKINRLADDVNYNLNKTQKLKKYDKALSSLDNLEKLVTENNKPANNNLEPFSNIDEYKIQYLSPDYKKIMLSDASCNELDTGFNESINCNDSNYNKNDENIKNCMQRAWCEYQGLSKTLHDNQTQSSEDKERYQDANQYYNLAVVDSINLTIGILGVVFLILKNRNII